MSPGRRRRTPPLTLVASSDAASTAHGARTGDGQSPAGERDWTALMARAQDGDRHAYRALLEDVAPFLRALASRCFKDSGDIEDAVQDVLLTVHAVRHAYDPRRPFGPWLVAIANRRVIDRLRRQTRARFREAELTVAHETRFALCANLPAEAEPSDDRSDDLQAAIANLPPDQREAIKLLKLDEMSLKQAASVTGRSIAALKVATHRAMKRLRRLLQAPGETRADS